MTGLLISLLIGQGLFARRFVAPRQEWGMCVTQTSDGGYALVGTTWSFGVGCDILFIKLDPQGNLEWARAFGGSDYEYPCSVIQSSDGGYVIAGGTNSFGYQPPYYDFLVFKLSLAGDIEWARTYGWDRDEMPDAMIQVSGGNYAIAGYTSSIGSVRNLV